MKIDIIDPTPIGDILDGTDIEEQLSIIRLCTFSNFIRSHQMLDFVKELGHAPRMPTTRFVYLYFLCRKIKDFVGDSRYCDYIDRIINNNKDMTDYEKDHRRGIFEVYRACESLGQTERTNLCLIVEAMTRGQHENVIWDLLRDGTISSSKMQRTIKRQISSKNIFDPWPIDNDQYVASAVAFGLRCEGVVKNILRFLIRPGDTSILDMGFMLSPIDALFGASLDMCFNASFNKDGTVNFHSDCEIYEIKCRFKYTFSKIEFDPIYPTYQRLYAEPNKKNFIDFINSISKPAVEFLLDGRIPTERDYLLTFDNDWNIKQQRKRKMCAIHQAIERTIKSNSYTESTVYILSDPSLTNGKIDIKAQFKTCIFINPKHAYFYQILLQYKITTNYIQYNADPAGNTLGKPKTYVVSAFFRKRNSEDPTDCTIGQENLSIEQEIPVVVIVTPVYIPAFLILESISKAAEVWKNCAEKEFEHAPWAPSALFAGGDITP